ncbi:MAG: glutamate--cysteine ligase [Betaproteobacteria bacterium]|nr:glutamate--cysteine ligase [Betaproteobacteria bacterium]
MSTFERRLSAIAPGALAGILRGVEKEGLRVRPDGSLAMTPHPAGLGSALTHPHITTDFSESQLELITGVHTTPEACVAELTELHQVVYRNLDGELLWCASMPCRLPADDEIPLGQYGSANLARMKTTYRHGLSHRYGRRMQTISGIHYNFSLPEEAWPLLQRAEGDDGPAELFQDRGYFSLMRNFRRHSWLLLLLLGASPAVCGTFVRDRPHRLLRWDTGTYVAPFGTSLRMGPLGYQSDAQASLAVSFNSLRGYAASLNRALSEAYPAYEAIGLRDATGNYRQLSTTLLQIENEFYGTVRPKRRIHRGERPLRALGERGVEYVEVRCIDVSPYHPVGIDAAGMRMIDLFLLHCLLTDSPLDSPREIASMSRNQYGIAERGREPELRLERGVEAMAPAAWGREFLAQCEPIAAALDAAHTGTAYREVLEAAVATLAELSLLPSARILEETQSRFGRSYPALALAYSERHRDTLLGMALDAGAAAKYAQMAAGSIAEQREIEAADDVPFETFRERYLGQDMVSGAHFRETR